MQNEPSLPGNMMRFFIISPKIHPTDQISARKYDNFLSSSKVNKLFNI